MASTRTRLEEFEDFLPTMADKLGAEGLMGELCNGFNLLMDQERGLITFESLKRNAAHLGLGGLKDDELRSMLREGDMDGDGALSQMEFCVLMLNWWEWVALSPISSEGEEGSAESPIMPALKTLEFIDCPKLEAMPPILTTPLRRLDVDGSSPMLYHRSFLQFLPLPIYETIAIIGNRWKAESTEDAHNPLIRVVIGEKATELPGSLLHHHTALRKLILVDLLLLRSLPDELTQLTALQQLIIRKCPELSGRCRVGGELWPKIACIPHIEIDGQDIQNRFNLDVEEVD